MTINETIDGLQEIINRNQRTILPRVHIGYLIHAVKYLKEQKEEIENLKQTAQSMIKKEKPNMKSFDFIQTAPEAGDCTAPYDILFHRKMTVGEFVKEILTRNEWGYIDIYDPKDKENWYRRRGISCSYRYDELKSNFSDDILKQTIISASAHGGWTRMDYTLTLEETDKRQIDKEENSKRQIDKEELKKYFINLYDLLGLLIEYGQHDKQFKLGEIIKYDPVSVVEIAKEFLDKHH